MVRSQSQWFIWGTYIYSKNPSTDSSKRTFTFWSVIDSSPTQTLDNTEMVLVFCRVSKGTSLLLDCMMKRQVGCDFKKGLELF